MKINKERSTVFDESCLQRMASLTGRWQGLKLVNLRALSRTKDQSRLAIGISRDNLGLVGSAAPANLFSSLSQPACRLNPHPCAQVYYGKPKKLAVDLIIWSGELWITSTFSFHPDTRNTESLLSKGTRSSLINSIGRRSVHYQMSSISSNFFVAVFTWASSARGGRNLWRTYHCSSQRKSPGKTSLQVVSQQNTSPWLVCFVSDQVSGIIIL